jgi:hypothetical protein
MAMRPIRRFKPSDFRRYVSDAASILLENENLRQAITENSTDQAARIRGSLLEVRETIAKILSNDNRHPTIVLSTDGDAIFETPYVRKKEQYQEMLQAVDAVLNENFSEPSLRNLHDSFLGYHYYIDGGDGLLSDMPYNAESQNGDPTSDIFEFEKVTPGSGTPSATNSDINIVHKATKTKKSGSKESSTSDEKRKQSRSIVHDQLDSDQSESSAKNRGASLNQSAASGKQDLGEGDDQDNRSAPNEGKDRQSVGSHSRPHTGLISKILDEISDYNKKLRQEFQAKKDIIDGDLAKEAQEGSKSLDEVAESNEAESESAEPTFDEQTIAAKANEQSRLIKVMIGRQIINDIHNSNASTRDISTISFDMNGKGDDPSGAEGATAVEWMRVRTTLPRVLNRLKNSLKSIDNYDPDSLMLNEDSMILHAAKKGKPYLGDYRPIGKKKGYIAVGLDTSGSMISGMPAFASHMLSFINGLKNADITYAIYHCDVDVHRIDVLNRRDARQILAAQRWTYEGTGGTNMTNNILTILEDTKEREPKQGPLFAIVLYTDCADSPLDVDAIKAKAKECRIDLGKSVYFIVATAEPYTKRPDFNKYYRSVRDLDGIVTYIESRELTMRRRPLSADDLRL